ncbi:putative B3 domain-containing protein Os03g0621600 [Phalaenopsis equestris]|uniref:putative B3 domain-containing protein Os03g0621600 n=1 Tax=Phalaenopsis equestris TaxID=78828 RepID=UPI0009E38AB2|nr:putative B3 domain-containing protein Os03g0621600 [Phalaenopsis equestris]
MGEECRHCKKWKEHCKKFEEHFYWDHVDVKKMHFSKSMTGDFSKCMVLPKKFIERFKGELLETVELKVLSGDKWHVELKKTCDGVVLNCGWRNFVAAHGILENDTLVFKYDGCSSFLVLMFEQSGCEKVASHCSMRKDRMEELCAIASGKKPRLHSNRSSSMNYEQPNPLTVDRITSRAHKDVKEKHFRKRKDTKSVPRRKKHFAGSRRKNSLNEQESAVIEGTTSGGDEVSLTEQGDPMDFIISKKARLTDVEKNVVVRFADTIQTDRPSFVSIMVPSSTSKRFYLTIPMSFAIQYLPRSSRRVLLQVKDKESSWSVHCLVQSHSVGFSSGWKAFVQDNQLKVGDICFFELLEAEEEDILMTVHINRTEEALPF